MYFFNLSKNILFISQETNIPQLEFCIQNERKPLSPHIKTSALFLGAKAPLGLAHVTVTVSQTKKFKNSIIMQELREDLIYCLGPSRYG